MAGQSKPNSGAGIARAYAEAHPELTTPLDLINGILAERPELKPLCNALRLGFQGALGPTRRFSARRNTVRQQAAAAPEPKPEPTIEERLGVDRRIRTLQAERNEATAKSKHLLELLERAEKDLNTALAIGQALPELVVPKPEDGLRRAGTACVFLSDWHVEQRVEKRMVHGYNEYNPDIARRRALNVFQNIVRQVRAARQAGPVDTLLLALLGDFINGFIHEELRETNFMTPIEATMFAKELLMLGIQFLLDHGGFQRILVPCLPGNHGRNTKKTQYANAYKHSHEWMMYHWLQQYFAGEPRIAFDIPESPYAYVSIYGEQIRLFHGEQVKYQGGIGGLSVPLIKHVQRQNQTRKVTLNVIGHFHQYLRPQNDILVNPSLIGYDTYAQVLGCNALEPPAQTMLLLDSQYGFYQDVRLPAGQLL